MYGEPVADDEAGEEAELLYAGGGAGDVVSAEATVEVGAWLGV